MQYRTLGASGLEVSAVGLGSWLTFGASVSSASAQRLVGAAFERGVNLFDTADVYAEGEGERALGEAIRDLPRRELVLASKCFFPFGAGPNDRGLSRKHVHESLAGSLRRLGVEYLDLYQCHRFDEKTPLLETAMAMDELIRRGLVLYWGVSQWPAARIAEVAALCREHGLHRPISNQPVYNLFDRGIEAEVIPVSEREGLGQLAFSPLAQGVLTGKYREGEPLPRDSRAADPSAGAFVGRYLTPQHLAASRRLTELARRLGHAPSVVALAWCLRDRRVASALVGARTEQQLLENLAAADVTLPADALRELAHAFAASFAGSPPARGGGRS